MTAAFVVLWVLVLIGVPALAAMVVLILRSDLLRRFDRTGEVSFDGRSRSVVTADVNIPVSHAREAAAAALVAVGCRRTEEWANWVVGWTQFPFLGESPVGLRSEPQQVAIEAVPLPDGHANFVCSSQPRYSVTWMDMGKSQRMTAKVIAQLQAGPFAVA